MLRLVRLDGFGDRRPDQLSGGQQQRVALARALIYRPQILLMDEPLGALDKKLREEIQAEIRRIHQELAVTIVYVTHDQEEALRLSDRICLFSHGRIIQIGTGEDLYERPASTFVASFVGSSNFMEIDVEAASDKIVASRLPDGTAIYAQRGTRPTAGSKASLMVRPERMRLAQTRKNGANDSVIDVTILDATYLGDTIHYDVGTRWGPDPGRPAIFGNAGWRGIGAGKRGAFALELDGRAYFRFGNCRSYQSLKAEHQE